jgi:hypothetical protein
VSGLDDPDWDPVPMSPSSPGCSAGTKTGRGHAGHCGAPVVYAAVWREPHTRHRWRVFLCAAHGAQREVLAVVDNIRELTDPDREALKLRRSRWATAQAGKGWVPPKPLPPTTSG